jgi:hypothetical protein
VNKTNRCTEFQFYWYYYSTCSGRISAWNMWSSNTNKIGIQCICWFYSQGICYDAWSYDRKIHWKTFSWGLEQSPLCYMWHHTAARNTSHMTLWTIFPVKFNCYNEKV